MLSAHMCGVGVCVVDVCVCVHLAVEGLFSRLSTPEELLTVKHAMFVVQMLLDLPGGTSLRHHFL